MKVAPAVTAISFPNSSYDVKLGQTTNVSPQFSPTNAYNALTVTSSSTAVATVTHTAGGPIVVRGVAAGSATITARGHNSITGTFSVVVKAPLENALIQGAANSTYTMTAGGTWTVPVTLQPAGASADHTLTSSNSAVVRIDGNTTAVALSAGTARIEAKIGGVVKSTCTVTVNALPPASKPVLAYVGVTHESADKAGLSMRVSTPVSGATYYVFAEHNNVADAKNGVNPKAGRSWMVTASQASSAVNMGGFTTGLRFISCTAFSGATSNYSSSNPLSGTKLSHEGNGVAILYHPRWVGGKDAAGDGLLNATMFMMPMFGGYLMPVYMTPWQMRFTFEQVPNAVGYEYTIESPGMANMSGTLMQPANSSTRLMFIKEGFGLGVTTVYVQPFVYDTDGITRVRGETRKVEFIVSQTGWGAAGLCFYDTYSTVNNPVLPFLLNF